MQGITECLLLTFSLEVLGSFWKQKWVRSIKISLLCIVFSEYRKYCEKVLSMLRVKKVNIDANARSN